MENSSTQQQQDVIAASTPFANPKQRSSFGLIGPQRYPISYVNIPKSACTSIKCMIYYLDHGRWPEDPLAIHQRREVVIGGPGRSDNARQRLASDFLFTFVRHPLRRAYSAFNEKINFVGPYSFLLPRQRLELRYGARFSEQPSLDEHRRNFLLFLSFVAHMMKSSRKKNFHFAPQAHCISRIQLYRTIDFIGRVENISEDIQFILRKARFEEELSIPRFNEGPSPPYRYEEILTDEILTAGKRIYRDDFRLFGYSID